MVSVEKLVSTGKTAIQSSTAYRGVPARALDGNKNTDYFKGSCTHTAREKNPFWQVDLGQAYHVTKVVITNRGDCCFERLSNFEIRVGKYKASSGNPACVEHAKLGKGETKAFKCDLVGSQVNVRIIGTQFLTLCEVQVLALVPVGNGGDFVEKRLFLDEGSLPE
ncbi:hypothetical protein BSKO_12591 [Bryopsis sp. KO-2023]|nr:hypothetical protein BSKO_12591 [Bryopsis sp. KO-2023]